MIFKMVTFVFVFFKKKTASCESPDCMEMQYKITGEPCKNELSSSVLKKWN